jgi:uncharacterized protein (DUF2141 family)
MVRLPASVVRDVLLPANLIVMALIVFGALASSVDGDLRFEASGGAAPAAAPAEHGKLIVKVVRVRNDSGKVQVWVYASGPMQDGANIVARQALPASAGGVTAVFDDLPRRIYAVMAVHDENGNGTPDLPPGGGPPAEGIGTSGEIRLTRGPPRFEDARFALDRDELAIEVPVIYH